MRSVYQGLFFIAIFVLSFTVSQRASAKDVYLTLVEPAGGLSFLGHAALIISEDDASPLTGMVYSYSIRGATDIQFRADKYLGLSFFQQTSIIENRSMVLLKLNLTSEEKSKLEEKVQSDVTEGESFGAKHTFNALDMNCVTYLLEQLNAVTSGEKQINVQPHSAFWTTVFGGPWTFLDNIRFRAPVPAIVNLESHPIAGDKLRWIPRFEVRQAQTMATRLQPSLAKLAACKGWKSRTVETIGLTLAIGLKQQNVSLLKSIRQLQVKSRKCESEEKLNAEFWSAAYDVLPLTAGGLRGQIHKWMQGES